MEPREKRFHFEMADDEERMEDVSSPPPSTVAPSTEDAEIEEQAAAPASTEDDPMEEEETPAVSSPANPPPPAPSPLRSSMPREDFVRDLTPEESTDDVSEVEYTVTEDEESEWAHHLITEEQFAQLRDDPLQLLLLVEQNAEEKWAQQQIDEIDQAQDIHSLQSEKLQLTQRVATLEEEMKAMRDEQQSSAAELPSQSTLDELQRQLDDAEQKAILLNSDLEKAHADQNATNIRLESKEQQYNQLKGELERVSSQCDEALKEKAASLDSLSAVQSQLEDTQRQLKSLQEEHTRVVAQNKELSQDAVTQAQSATEEKQRLMNQIEASKQSTATLQARLDTSEGLVRESKLKMAALNTENTSLIAKVSSLRTQLQESEDKAKRDLKTKQDRIELYQALEKELEQLRTSHVALRDEKKRLAAANQRAEKVHQTQIDQWKKQLETAQKELQQYRQHSIAPSPLSDMAEGQTVLMNLVNKYEDATRQLQEQRSENKQLNTYLSAILKEIETKAPALQLQKRQFQKIKLEKHRLTQLVKSSIEHSESLKEQVTTQQHTIESLKQEADLLRKETTVLLQENATLRKSDQAMDTDAAPTEESTEQTEDLYRSVEELMNRNQELQRRVGELEQYKAEGYDLLYKKALADIQSCESSLAILTEKNKRLQLETERHKSLYDTQRAIYESSTGHSAESAAPAPTAEYQILQQEYEKLRAQSEKVVSTLQQQMEEYKSQYSIEKFVSLESRLTLLQDRNSRLTDQLQAQEREIAARLETDQKQRDLIKEFEEQTTTMEKQITETRNDLQSKKQSLAALTAEKEALQATSERWKADLAHCRADNERLCQNVLDLQSLCNAERASAQRRVQRLSDECQQTRQELLKLQEQSDAEYSKYRETLTTRQEQVTTAQMAAKEAKSQLSALQKDIAAKDRKITHLQQQIDQLNTFSEQNDARMQRIAKSMKSGDDDSSQTLQDLNAQLARANSKVQLLEGLVESQKEETITEQSRITDLKAVIHSLEEEKNQAVTRANQLQEELDAKNSSMMDISEPEQQAELEKQVQTAQDALKESISHSASQTKQLETLRSQINDLQGQLNALQEKYDQRIQIHSADLKNLQTANQELQAVKQENASLQKNLEAVRNSADEKSYEAESQLESLRSRATELERENTALLAKVSQLVTKSHSLRKEQEARAPDDSMLTDDDPHADTTDALSAQDTITELRDMLAYMEREKSRFSLSYEDLHNEKEFWENKYRQLLDEFQMATAAKAMLEEEASWKSKFEEQAEELAKQTQLRQCQEETNQEQLTKLRRLTAAAKKLKEQLKQEQEKLSALQKEYNALKKDQSEVVTMRERLKTLEKQLAEEKRKLNEMRAQHNKLTTELTQSTATVDELTAECNTHKENLRKCKRLVAQEKKQVQHFKNLAASLSAPPAESTESAPAPQAPAVEEASVPAPAPSAPAEPVAPVDVPTPVEVEAQPAEPTEQAENTSMDTDETVEEVQPALEVAEPDVQMEEPQPEPEVPAEPEQEEEPAVEEEEAYEEEGEETAPEDEGEPEEVDDVETDDEVEDEVEKEEVPSDGEQPISTEQPESPPSEKATTASSTPAPSFQPVVFAHSGESPTIGKRKERPEATPAKPQPKKRPTPAVDTIKKIVAPTTTPAATPARGKKKQVRGTRPRGRGGRP